MAEVTARKRGAKWEYRFEMATIGGKRKQYSKSGFRTKKEALQAGAEAFSKYNKNGYIKEYKDMSVADLAKLWMEQYAKKNLKLGTQYDSEKTIDKHILPALGEYNINAVRRSVIQEFANSLELAEQTMQRIISLLHSIFKFAVRMEFIETNPVNDIVIPKGNGHKDERQPVSFENFKKIILMLPECYATPCYLGFYCGLRISEALSVTWDDINFDNMTIRIDKQIVSDRLETLKNKSSVRTIKFGEALSNALKEEKARQLKNRSEYREYYTTYTLNDGLLIKSKKDDYDFVCRRENGKYILRISLATYLKKLSEKIGIPFSFHSFRHGHTTILIENHAPIKAVQNRLGHSTPQTTMNIYSHITQKQIDEAVDIFEKVAHDLPTKNSDTIKHKNNTKRHNSIAYYQNNS